MRPKLLVSEEAGSPLVQVPLQAQILPDIFLHFMGEAVLNWALGIRG